MDEILRSTQIHLKLPTFGHRMNFIGFKVNLSPRSAVHTGSSSRRELHGQRYGRHQEKLEN